MGYSSIEVGTWIYDIPADIMSDILLRLPVKSILYFRCTCKAFEALTKTPDFKAMHNSLTTATTNTLCAVFCKSFEKDKTNILLVQEEEEGEDKALLSVKQLFLEPLQPYRRYSIIGSCNGLFCFFVWDQVKLIHSFLLWNPVTKQTKYLPNPQHKIVDLVSLFGFVPTTNDYKVVIVTVPIIQVYKMSSDSWISYETTSLTLSDYLPRNVQFNIYNDDYDYDNDYDRGWLDATDSLHSSLMDVSPIQDLDMYLLSDYETTFFRGAFHWIALVPIPKYQASNNKFCFIGIMSFNISDEQLRLVDVLGPDMVAKPYGSTVLCILYESLCMIVRGCHENMEPYFNIWSMKDYEIRESWTKIFCLGEDIPRSNLPVGCWKDCLLLGECGRNSELYIYRLSTGERRSLPVQKHITSFTCFTYIETFVSVSSASPMLSDAAN